MISLVHHCLYGCPTASLVVGAVVIVIVLVLLGAAIVVILRGRRFLSPDIVTKMALASNKKVV